MAHILLAEDDPDIRTLVEIRLSVHGHSVVAVGDGLAAAAAWDDLEFDLLITDVTMPGMDGIALVRWVRSHARGPARPVLVMSAASTTQVRANAAEAGASAYLAKPFPLTVLTARVDDLLSSP